MDIQDYKRKFEAKFNLSINSTDWHTHFSACVQEEKQHSKSVLEKRISTATAMRQAYDRFVSWYIDAPGLRMCKEPVNWDTVYLLLNAAAGYGYCVTLAMFQKDKELKLRHDLNREV